MFDRFRHLLELIRFSHTVFALPFALLAGLMAWTYRSELNGAAAWRWREALGILSCMIFGRSVAMAFNRIADRKIDANNPRTKSRHLPAGVLNLNIVAAFALACAAGFVLSTLLFLPENPWPLYLS